MCALIAAKFAHRGGREAVCTAGAEDGRAPRHHRGGPRQGKAPGGLRRDLRRRGAGSPTSWKRLRQAPSPPVSPSAGDVLALVDHDPGRVLARTRSGTLRLARGQARARIRSRRAGDDGTVNDVLALAERGDLGGMSFAFSVKRERWDGERRTLESRRLARDQRSCSAWPAYRRTRWCKRARGRSCSSARRGRAPIPGNASDGYAFRAY